MQANIARPWWKSPLALVAALVVLIAGGAAAYALTNGGSGGGGGGGAGGGGGNNSRGPVAGLKPPTCSPTAANAKSLPVRTSSFPVPAGSGNPFGIAASPDGKSVFVTTDTSVRVFAVRGGGSLTPGPSYTVASSGSPGRAATTVTLASEGKYLLVAAEDGIQVLDTAAAVAGASNALLGTLKVPGLTKHGRAINVAVTPDGHFAFVSLQFANVVGVFNLFRAVHSGNFESAYIGSLNVGDQPVGLAVSPDGQILYATNYVSNAATPGTLTIIDVPKATDQRTIKTAKINHVTTGCFPSRIAVTGDNSTVWVTVRQSNYVLGYSASLLRKDPANALQAKVKVGQWPIGLALVKNDSRIVISDNNGTDTSATSTSSAHNLAVVDTGAALSRKRALIGYIPSGVTPHEIAVSPDGKYLYVIDRDSAKVQVVDLSKLP